MDLVAEEGRKIADRSDGQRCPGNRTSACLVDIKVCAVDEVWSGLKFVYRLADRSVQK